MRRDGDYSWPPTLHATWSRSPRLDRVDPGTEDERGELAADDLPLSFPFQRDRAIERIPTHHLHPRSRRQSPIGEVAQPFGVTGVHSPDLGGFAQGNFTK